MPRPDDPDYMPAKDVLMWMAFIVVMVGIILLCKAAEQ